MSLLPILATIAATAGVVNAVNASASASATAWASSSDGSLLLSSYPAPVLGAANPGIAGWQFAINEVTGKKQTVKGFGASVTDATVTVFNALSSDMRSQLLNDLMTDQGINFSLMRHTIGSSDLSAAPAYTYDDNSNSTDLNLTSFGLGDRGTAMASMLADMRTLQPNLTILGSSWSPPGWMKQDGELLGSTTDNSLNHDYADEFADYFVKYLQAYEQAGAHIDAITIQNEPLNDGAEMPTMLVQAAESGDLILNQVAPALSSAGLDTQIWAYDHNTDVPSYPETVLNITGNLVPAVAWHCYAGNDPTNWAPLTQFHDMFPGTEQYMTECWTSAEYTNWVYSSDFNMLPLQNWANGIIAWTLGTWTDGGPVLPGSEPCNSCTGIVTVSPDGSNYTKTMDYYMMGQFSKFIPLGATVVNGTGSYLYSDNTGMESVATINPDGTRTVVIQNTFSYDIWASVGTQSESQTWNGRIPADSVVTWVLPQSAALTRRKTMRGLVNHGK